MLANAYGPEMKETIWRIVVATTIPAVAAIVIVAMERLSGPPPVDGEPDLLIHLVPRSEAVKSDSDERNGQTL
jgi:hypothetical protein